jgi:Holliday junction resolvase-like predicted endonuclease
MPVFSRLIFYAVRFGARRGLRDDENHPPPKPAPGQPVDTEKFQQKEKARRTGLRGETYGYWYLRRHGYVFVAKNYMPQGVKGELDLVGYDGQTLAFVEIRTRTLSENPSALPELSVTYAKQSVLIRTAHRFLADRHIRDCPMRFDVLAIDNVPGLPGSPASQGRLQPAITATLTRIFARACVAESDNHPGAAFYNRPGVAVPHSRYNLRKAGWQSPES